RTIAGGGHTGGRGRRWTCSRRRAMASDTLAEIDMARVVVAELNYGKREWKGLHEPTSEDATDVVIMEALRCAALEISRLTRDLEARRRIGVELRWMARRYADGRTSYATRLFNDHTRAVVALGVELNRTSDGTISARDGMGRAYDG